MRERQKELVSFLFEPFSNHFNEIFKFKQDFRRRRRDPSKFSDRRGFEGASTRSIPHANNIFSATDIRRSHTIVYRSFTIQVALIIRCYTFCQITANIETANNKGLL